MAEPQSGAWIRIDEKLGTILMSIACFAMAVAFLIGGARYDFGTFSIPGPAVFPVAAAVVMMVMCSVLVVQTLRMPGSAGGVRVELGHRNSVTAMLVLCLVALGFEFLGYIVVSFLMLLTLTRAFSDTGWARSALFAGGVAVLSYAVFTLGLGVVLPAGLLRFA